MPDLAEGKSTLPDQEWIRDAEAVEEVQIMEELPHTLRREIAFSINAKMFKPAGHLHDFPVKEQALIAANDDACPGGPGP